MESFDCLCPSWYVSPIFYKSDCQLGYSWQCREFGSQDSALLPSLFDDINAPWLLGAALADSQGPLQTTFQPGHANSAVAPINNKSSQMGYYEWDLSTPSSFDTFDPCPKYPYEHLATPFALPDTTTATQHVAEDGTTSGFTAHTATEPISTDGYAANNRLEHPVLAHQQLPLTPASDELRDSDCHALEMPSDETPIIKQTVLFEINDPPPHLMSFSDRQSDPSLVCSPSSVCTSPPVPDPLPAAGSRINWDEDTTDVLLKLMKKHMYFDRGEPRFYHAKIAEEGGWPLGAVRSKVGAIMYKGTNRIALWEVHEKLGLPPPKSGKQPIG